MKFGTQAVIFPGRMFSVSGSYYLHIDTIPQQREGLEK